MNQTVHPYLEKYQFIIALAGVVAGFLVVLVAVAGDSVRRWLAKPKLTIEIEEKHGQQATEDDVKLIYFHLSVKNSRPQFPAKNCRVLLVNVAEHTGTSFKPVTCHVPYAFLWAGKREDRVSPITIVESRVFDFGILRKDSQCFMLITEREYPAWRITKGQSKRYVLMIEAENSAPLKFAFEIHWTGTWHDEPELAANEFTIRKVMGASTPA